MWSMRSRCITFAGVLALVASPVLAQVARVPRVPQSLRPIPTEAEIVAALQTGDIDSEKSLMMTKAAELPPHSLRDSTISAISQRVVDLWRQIQVQFELDPSSRHDGDPDAEYLEALVGVLKHQKSPAGIDGLVTVGPYYATVADIAQFGDPAVPALVRRVRRPESSGEIGHINGALDALEQMLEQPAIRSKLSAGSRALIRQVAVERMKDLGRPETAWSTLAHACYLAVATGDLQLRKQVTDLVADDVELRRRGVTDPEKQEWFKKEIGEALDKKFQD
jgi:hypothetical protein